MENPNSTSQDVPKFLSICPISMAQFQEKFIFLGKKKKPLPMCQSELIILESDQRWGGSLREKNPLSLSLQGKILDLTAVGLLHTQPMPVTVAREVPCALNNQGPPLKLSYQW